MAYWNRQLTYVTLINFLLFMNLSVFFLLPRHLSALGAGEAEIGMTMASLGLVSVVLMPLVGILLDRHGRRPLLLLGACIMALASGLFSLPDRMGIAFYALRMLHGLGFALFLPTVNTLAADHSDSDHRGRVLALVGVFALLAHSVAPAFGEFVAYNVGFKVLFLVSAVFPLVALALIICIEETPRAPAEARPVGLSLWSLLKRPELVVPAVTTLCVASGFGACMNFMATFSQEQGLKWVAPFFVAYSIAAAGVRVIPGSFPGPQKLPRAILFALGAYVAALAHIAVLSTTLHLVLLGALLGMAHGINYPAMGALVVNATESSARGRAMALFSVSFALGLNVGTLAYGAVAQFEGYRSMYFAAAAVAAAGFVVFLSFCRRLGGVATA